jgi:hypothetical protein
LFHFKIKSCILDVSFTVLKYFYDMILFGNNKIKFSIGSSLSGCHIHKLEQF